MSGYIQYSEHGGQNMPFVICDKIIMCWQNIIKFRTKFKRTLGIKFHSKPVYDEKYIKAKIKNFNGVFNTNFLVNKRLKEGVHYTFIVCISVDSVMSIEKKNYLQVYLEECKCRVKKMSEFEDVE